MMLVSSPLGEKVAAKRPDEGASQQTRERRKDHCPGGISLKSGSSRRTSSGPAGE